MEPAAAGDDENGNVAAIAVVVVVVFVSHSLVESRWALRSLRAVQC